MAKEQFTIAGGRYDSTCFFRCGVPKNLTQTNFDGAFKLSSCRLLNVTSQNMARFLHTNKEVRIFHRRVNIVVSAFLRESVWPQTKLLPKSWTKWREKKRRVPDDIEESICTSGH